MAQLTMKREHELHSRRRGRNLGVLVVLIGLVVMLFLTTVVKMGQGPEVIVGNPSASQAGGWAAEDFAAPFRPEEATQ
ncbi:MAG: hypothetical protein AAF698_02695 [Pseudomonadota bacterium]